MGKKKKKIQETFSFQTFPDNNRQNCPEAQKCLQLCSASGVPSGACGCVGLGKCSLAQLTLRRKGPADSDFNWRPGRTCKKLQERERERERERESCRAESQ